MWPKKEDLKYNKKKHPAPLCRYFWFTNCRSYSDCDINPSWTAEWWPKLGASGFSGISPQAHELQQGWETSRVNRSWHRNTDVVWSSEGRAWGCACCICIGSTKGKDERSLGLGVSKQGQEKNSGNRLWCSCKTVLCVRVSWFPQLYVIHYTASLDSH